MSTASIASKTADAKTSESKSPKLSPAAQAILAASSNPKKSQVRVRRGQVEAFCRFGADGEGHWVPADAETFFVLRSSGGLHLHARCRGCDKAYREALRSDEGREVKARTREEVDPDVLRAVFEHVLLNFAVRRADVIEGTGLDPRLVDRALATLDGSLLVGEEVNGQRGRVWQSHFDCENDRQAKTAGKRAFAAWLKARQAEQAAKVDKVEPVEATEQPKAKRSRKSSGPASEAETK